MNLKGSAKSLAQSTWLGCCVPQAFQFYRAACKPLAQTQKTVLQEILSLSKDTAIAKHYQFDQIRSVSDFQKLVPLNDYESLKPFINEASKGKKHILTNEKIQLFELTSGSTSASKLIPYTRSLQNSFNRALHPWLLDLYLHNSSLIGGSSYWVITPKYNENHHTEGGIPIGFASDSDYFGSLSSKLIEFMMAVPETVSKIKDTRAWKYATLLSLIRSEDLRLISLWNPGFLFSLLKNVPQFSDLLIKDLKYGSCSVATNLKNFKTRPAPKRANCFATAVKYLEKGNMSAFCQTLWPELKLISTWTEAESKIDAQKLSQVFPQARIQTKGILATEGPVTIPLTNAPAPVLAFRSSFFEFLPFSSNSKSKPKLAHQLKTGETYKLVMTTFGGLFRYKLNDIVRVKGFWKNIPCFEFVQKEAFISDLCGEKLNAKHVSEILKTILGKHSTAFLAPEKNCENTHYRVFMSIEELKIDPKIIRDSVEKALKENFHYNWCIENGQLNPCQLSVFKCSSQDLNNLRFRRLQQKRIQISTVNLTSLSKLDGWHNWLLETDL